MMSLASRRELRAAVAPRYRTATRQEQGRILDEFIAATGYARKYAIQVLNHAPPPRRRQKRVPARRYTPQVKDALVKLWRLTDGICSKRLVAGLEPLVTALQRHGELSLDAETQTLLLGISPATVDRLLRDERRRQPKRGRATTKPGTLLKDQIPIRTFADWDDATPGFVEIDLVAHCDDSTGGEFLYSLTLTDVATQWTECEVLLNRSQAAVTTALGRIRGRLPFALQGIDSDNGSEFINAHLLRYCRDQKLTFTRSRAYKKNDQAHVEQKNWSVVRRTIGYDRLEGAAAQQALQAVYGVLRLSVNFFLPVMKLVEKTRVDNKVRKKYDDAATPYQRVLDSGVLSVQAQAELRQMYETLNPAGLKRRLETLLNILWQHVRVRSLPEATLPPG